MIYPQTTKIYFPLYPSRIPVTAVTAGRVNSFALSPKELRGSNRNHFGNQNVTGNRFEFVYGLEMPDLAAVQYGDFSDTDRFGGEVAAGFGAGRMAYGRVGYLAETGNFSRVADMSMQ